MFFLLFFVFVLYSLISFQMSGEREGKKFLVSLCAAWFLCILVSSTVYVAPAPLQLVFILVTVLFAFIFYGYFISTLYKQY
ncbi:hypothetical protein [Salirhabdus salicampi]|uniref:hypothetical protein n=1 Tax=Salirhabdus salicampi TaxID=476102 RepID=UPI0020C2B650|nr:hypothetical protein [Salirhabdus salicampi]MCP8615441.1 hypothetical protein [Salirhabdus salicampi]